MSKYTTYYDRRQIMYRDLARAWKEWADGEELPDYQVSGMKIFFRQIGKRFGLIMVFKNIGVI